jgi:hypothetical protein
MEVEKRAGLEKKLEKLAMGAKTKKFCVFGR